MPTAELFIKGKVQGVFYRATAKRVAKEMSITGWIRNTGDGDVQATITGTKVKLENFIAWCHKGPEKAEVREVVVNKHAETFFSDFSII